MTKIQVEVRQKRLMLATVGRYLIGISQVEKYAGPGHGPWLHELEVMHCSASMKTVTPCSVHGHRHDCSRAQLPLSYSYYRYSAA
jgi:hypothetical protein